MYFLKIKVLFIYGLRGGGGGGYGVILEKNYVFGKRGFMFVVNFFY